MDAFEIYNRWHVKPGLYHYIQAIGANPGMTNDALSKALYVSPQIVGRITRDLAARGAIVNLNEGGTALHRRWVLKDETLLKAIVTLSKAII